MMTSIYVLVSGRPGSVTVRRFLGQAPALRAQAALPPGTPVRYVGPAPRADLDPVVCDNTLAAALGDSDTLRFKVKRVRYHLGTHLATVVRQAVTPRTTP